MAALAEALCEHLRCAYGVSPGYCGVVCGNALGRQFLAVDNHCSYGTFEKRFKSRVPTQNGALPRSGTMLVPL
jgi:hypothetical protein